MAGQIESNAQFHSPTFTDLSIMLLPRNNWLPATITFHSERGGNFADFVISEQSLESSIRVYLHQSQVVRAGPTLLTWITKVCSDSRSDNISKVINIQFPSEAIISAFSHTFEELAARSSTSDAEFHLKGIWVEDRKSVTNIPLLV
eukprot:TRINITY_DN1797_c0_g1_i2.p1 TRINITY_DN1797_c0_g1~~TRINITY_DN1797_c0_g1_i2.p1  ORF type:complete len:146 (-),score=19.16 TRINITY_DN1797_c0_g1_i2:42-479(-)